MTDIFRRIRCYALIASTIFCFSINIDAQIVIGNLQVTGDTTLDGTLLVKGASETFRGNITLQKASGTGCPLIDFREASGSALKARLFANPTSGAKGFNISLDGTNPTLGVNDNGSIDLNGPTKVVGGLTVPSGFVTFSDDTQFASANKGTIFLSTSYTYTLGNLINFDSIDNSGSIVGGDPLTFMVPVTGDYLVTVKLTSDDLMTTEGILSAAVCQVEVVKNDTVVLCAYQSSVSPTSENHHELSGVIRASVGDTISASYTAWAIKLDGNLGEVAGTINLVGDENGLSSFMRVNYLSSEPPGPL